MPTPPSIIENLLQVRKDIGDCTRCALSAGRTNIVFGEGNPFADIMFIGEGPGEQEDLSGRPFVGRSGQLLDKGLETAGLSRDEVYIANTVKCRPPGNRDPLPVEKDTCYPFLQEQLKIIQPKVIVPLGRVSAERFLNRPVKITKEHGIVFEEPIWWGFTKVIVVYHPSYVLRNRNTQVEESFYADIMKAKEVADGLLTAVSSLSGRSA